MKYEKYTFKIFVASNGVAISICLIAHNDYKSVLMNVSNDYEVVNITLYEVNSKELTFINAIKKAFEIRKMINVIWKYRQKIADEVFDISERKIFIRHLKSFVEQVKNGDKK